MSELAEKAKAITDEKLPLVSNLANISAVLAALENINWCGFYIADGEKLFLGPFQGEPACTVIPFGKGVCGTAAERRETVIVDDVSLFKGHIACSSRSRSEIVVPVLRDGKTLAVIDIDAPVLSRFKSADASELEEIARFIEPLFKAPQSLSLSDV